MANEDSSHLLSFFWDKTVHDIQVSVGMLLDHTLNLECLGFAGPRSIGGWGGPRRQSADGRFRVLQHRRVIGVRILV